MNRHNKLECLFPAGFSQPRIMRVRQGAYPNRSKSVAVLFIGETLIFNPSLIFESGLLFSDTLLALTPNLGKYQRSSLFIWNFGDEEEKNYYYIETGLRRKQVAFLLGGTDFTFC
jgi:hypothetical protein